MCFKPKFIHKLVVFPSQRKVLIGRYGTCEWNIIQDSKEFQDPSGENVELE